MPTCSVQVPGVLAGFRKPVSSLDNEPAAAVASCGLGWAGLMGASFQTVSDKDS